MTKGKKWISVALVVMLVTTMLGIGTKSNSYAASVDTVPSGYVGIYTSAEFNDIRNDVNGKYILMNNLDLSELCATGTGWEPIGTETNPFTGILDGNGYSITNLSLHVPKENVESVTAGIFGFANYATISNLTLDATYDVIAAGAGNAIYCGGLVGQSKKITISNCSVTIDGIATAENIFLGGLVGRNDTTYSFTGPESYDQNQYVSIQNSSVKGNLTGIGSQYYIGGLIGYARDARIKDSSNEAGINSVSVGSNSGECCGISGLLGYGRSYQISSSANAGKLTSEAEDYLFTSVSGIVVDGNSVLNSDKVTYFPKTITSTTNSGVLTAINLAYITGIVGAAYSDDVTERNIQITGCNNTGAIKYIGPNEWAGFAAGIANSLGGGFIKESYNTGYIASTTIAAGIIYNNSAGEVEECYNIGAIEGGVCAAGIAYQNLDLIANCYNSGYIRSQYASGISLYNASYALLNDSYNIGGVESTVMEPAGIAGQNEAFVGDTYYFENTNVGVAENDSDAIDDSEKVYLDQLDDEDAFSEFDFGEPILESASMMQNGGISKSSGATTGIWKMSQNSNMPALNSTKEVYVTGISIIQNPAKSSYLVNQSVSTSGIVVKVTFSDGKKLYINKGLVVKPYSKSVGNRNITVSYGGEKASFPVSYSTFKASPSSYTHASLSWTGVSKATKYKIYRATSAKGKYSLIYTASSKARSYTNTGLTTGKTYYYKIRPMFGNTNGTISSAKAVKVVPGTPTLTIENLGNLEVFLNWKAVGGASYEIYRATSLGGKYTKIKTTSKLEYEDAGVTIGHTYYYKIRAYHVENKVKVYSSFSKTKWTMK